PILMTGKQLGVKVEQNGHQLVIVTIPIWPELAPDNQSNKLSLTGKLEFRYQNAEWSSSFLDRDSALEINQIFSSGLQEGLDDFF
ncbi:MAG: hypothetical protein AAFU03_16405, partial [Bacteroidota bacterium]